MQQEYGRRLVTAMYCRITGPETEKDSLPKTSKRSDHKMNSNNYRQDKQVCCDITASKELKEEK